MCVQATNLHSVIVCPPDYGSRTCAGYPGSINHMEQDAKVTILVEGNKGLPPTTPVLWAFQFNLQTKGAFLYKIQDKCKSIQKWILLDRSIQDLSDHDVSKEPKKLHCTLKVDSSVPLMHHDLKERGLIYLVKRRKIHFRILSDLTIHSWIVLKKRTVSLLKSWSVLATVVKLMFKDQLLLNYY